MMLQEVSLFDGRKWTKVTYTYDADGNLISEIGRDGNEKVQTYYDYTVENRLEAVYEGKKLLMAAAYDGDGNRVFQLNYNPTAYDDWKYTYGREGKRWEDWYDDCWAYWEDCDDERIEYDDDDNRNGSNNKETGNRGNNGRGNSLNGGCDGAVKSISNRVLRSEKNDGNHYDTDNNTGTQNGTDQSRYCMYFPSDKDDEKDERGDKKWLNKAWYHCRNNDYELIEYINDVNREYVEVLVEQNVFGKADTSYVYGVDRLSADTYCGRNSYYLYDGRGSVTGLTNEKGWLYQSYKYSVTGEITFGAPQYDNEYTYNGESYNPNIESQYLRARYYNVVTATFLTEDSYLGEITNPLTLNRYNYTLSNYLNYQDPSGHKVTKEQLAELSRYYYTRSGRDKYNTGNPTFWMLYRHLDLLDNIGSKNATVDYVTQYNYRNSYLANVAEEVRELRKHQYCQIGDVGFGESTIEYIVLQEGKPFLTPRINNNGSITIGFGYDFFEYENPEMFNRYLYRNAEGELVVKQEMTYEEAIETIHLAGESKKIFEALNSFVNGTGYGNMTAPITINQNQYNALFSYFYSNGANVFKDSKYEEWIEYGGEYAIRAVARIELRDYLIENNGNYDKEKLIELFVASKGANMNYEYKGRRASEAELFGSD